MDDRNDYQGEDYYADNYYPDAPPYGGEPPRKGLSRRAWIILAVVLGLLVVGALIGGGIIIDRILFPGKDNSADGFNLNKSASYMEALFDIQHYYYRDYSEEKITTAAHKAVEKEKKKGVKYASKLEDAGLRALVDTLGDHPSTYYDAAENQKLKEDIKGSFYGVGFVLREEKGQERPKVFSVIKGSPSDRAGIKKDDILMSVDGRDVKGVGVETIITWIRGKEGTKVELKLKRPGTGEVLTFKLTREKIQTPELETEILDRRYGVLHVFDFNKGVADKVRDAVKDMQQKGVQGFILDLRNNRGGLLDEGVKLASIFIKDGVIVSYRLKGEKKFDTLATGNPETDLPVVVLVNGMSASASEIVAGALKDKGRAVLVGSKTYGKGSVQKVYDLSNRGAAKLTISLYYLPNGESIDGKGIEPDVVVEQKDNIEQEEKLQLEKAKGVLQNLIEGKPPTAEALPPAA